MLKTVTLVKMRAGWTRERFFQRWCEHTVEWDLRDHPDIMLNRLLMVEGDSDYAGIAENHWPDKSSLEAAVGLVCHRRRAGALAGSQRLHGCREQRHGDGQ
jgi:hypothetical protein